MQMSVILLLLSFFSIFSLTLDITECQFLNFVEIALTDTGEDSKLVQRRKRSKLNATPPRYFLLLFSTRPSDEYDSVPSRKYSRSLLDVFACIG